MANLPSGKVRFIPYIGKDQDSRKARELLQSSAKSHAAKVAHKRTQKARESGRGAPQSGARGLTPKDPQIESSASTAAPPLTAQQSPPSTRNTVLASPDSTPSKTALPTAREFFEVESEQRLNLSRMRRSNDWHFGSESFSCRPLSDLDSAAIQYFLRHGPEQWPGANFSGKYPTASHGNLPVSEQLVRLAMQEQPLLDSLIAYTAFNMLNEQPNASVLKDLGRKASHVALQSVRQACMTPDHFQSLTLPYAVLHLCMASVSLGQPGAVYVHLKFLANVTKSVIPKTAYEYRLISQIRGIDLRYALQSGTEPITTSVWKPVIAIDQEASPHGALHMALASQMYLSTRPRSSFVGKQVGYSYQTLNLESEVQETAMVSFPESNAHQNGFYAAIQWSLLSVGMLQAIELYMEAMSYLSRLSHTTTITTSATIQARERCFACLELLCKKWYHWHSVKISYTSASPRSHHLVNSSDRVPKGLLDDIVIVTFELRIVMSMGRYSGSTLVILCRRLRSCMERDGLLEAVAMDQRGSERPLLMTRLLLWAALMGMLAVIGRSEEYQWLRNMAVQLVMNLRLDQEDEMLRTLAPFSPAGLPPGDDFVGIVRKLVSRLAELRDGG